MCGLAPVKAAFKRVWETSNLIVSMNAVIVWRQWSLDETCQPQTKVLCINQNPFSNPGLDCVQVMLPMVSVTESSGGLEVVPRRHRKYAKAAYLSRYPYMAHHGDWCPLEATDPMQSDGALLHAFGGDLVLWDLHNVHDGLVSTVVTTATVSHPELAWISITVAMTPRALAGNKVQQLRRHGFAAGELFNHCPHEAATSLGIIKHKLLWACARINLSEAQKALP